ncbi:MAG: RNase adapter RapZ [Ferruginibacter sp.]|nr:phosphotransferase [Ferruginibacter sp.]NOU38862.1 phosphotransferase [Ferruginibacter sp.]
MNLANEQIEQLFEQYSNDTIVEIIKLPQSGGDRVYYRLITKTNKSYIATYSNNLKENETFFYFTNHFKNIGAPVPAIFITNNEKNIYIQEDFGNTSLLDTLEKNGANEDTKKLYKKSLKALAHLQINGDKNLDYKKCITSKEFGKQAILSDFLYFKYYFLDTLKMPYDKEKLGDDLDALSTYLNHTDFKYFLFRDFQSRNVMIKNSEPFFIDYQGGMHGALQYDVASLLWQAKADLKDDWKNELVQYYIDCAEAELGQTIDRARFISQYNGYVLIRLLQVLGAYGFRGLFERKAHFLTSIPLALRNLKWFLNNNTVGISVPEFERVLTLIVEDEIIHRFEPVKATEDTALVVQIKSFSFLKTSYPKNVGDNGGGFVFDCRGILNPGRIEQHKTETGRDKPVQDFLNEKTRMDEFLAGVFSTVDISVEDYINRNFSLLEVNFGCTGGRHRSVFAADALARHLKNKYSVKTVVKHLEQNFAD